MCGAAASRGRNGACLPKPPGSVGCFPTVRAQSRSAALAPAPERHGRRGRPPGVRFCCRTRRTAHRKQVLGSASLTSCFCYEANLHAPREAPDTRDTAPNAPCAAVRLGTATCASSLAPAVAAHRCAASFITPNVLELDQVAPLVLQLDARATPVTRPGGARTKQVEAQSARDNAGQCHRGLPQTEQVPHDAPRGAGCDSCCCAAVHTRV